MKSIFIIFLLFASSLKGYSQMNFQDSSAQVVSYWDLGEQYEYSVNYQKLQFTEIDTTSNEIMTYDVEVSVIDSSENGYIVRWLYKNFNSNSTNQLISKLAKVSEDIAVDIKLDELGAIEGVENWTEVKDYMTKSFNSLKAEFPDLPEIEKMFNKLEVMYSSKVNIEATAIQDAQQFHSFHGGKYMLNEEISGQLLTPNVYYPERPFDTEVFVELEEMDEENNQFRIRSINEVNSEQLTQTTYEYLTEMFSTMNQDMPKREDFKNLTNTTEIVSRIHNTGWVLESVLWKEVITEGITNMEIRSIQLK